MQLVQEAWNTPVSSCAIFRVVKRLKEVKMKLKKLHRDHYSDIQNRLNGVKEQIEFFQNQLMRDSVDTYAYQRDVQLMKQYMELLSADEKLFRQRAKQRWATHIDINSAFFHASIKQRRARTD